MDDDRRAFLEELLATASPSGFETDALRRWVEYVEPFADEVTVDDYGNAVATVEGSSDSGPRIGFTGHADEIGFIVRDVTEDGFVRMNRIGGSDATVSRGQHVTVHTRDGPVAGVVGQAAIHLRDTGDESVPEITEQHVDVGAEDGDEAEELVDVGDPITVDQTVTELANDRIAARGLDNRVGIWSAAEGLRRAAERDPTATVTAVATVQEELGLKGAQMVGFDVDVDAMIAVDVTHATDDPAAPADRSTGVELGAGPVVARGSTNHPVVVEGVRETAGDADVDVQLAAAGSRTGTDADAFYTSQGGIPSLNLGVPNRYMHTPVEVVDVDDLAAVATLLGRFGARAEEFAPFGVSV